MFEELGCSEEEKEEEEEGLFKANAVNEEDPDRDRATGWRRWRRKRRRRKRKEGCETVLADH